ncbi:autotransporter secretion outer membrane protein TamA [Shewanella psychrophila]|uniref:Translocation and assembly module subunit TamA n=2 Tax=Shewanella psychrophila TaxID=225848 RepID=A0A1S6HLQ2_9GAMM|nr:autotransporter secretion outer membrane protein TamA [Shewanella psychrophila]
MSGLLSTFSVMADDFLTLKLTGIDASLTQNIEAHLGTLPTSQVQRRAFIFNAEDNVNAALNSLGYYHGEVAQDVQERPDQPWVLSLDVTPGAPTRIEWIDLHFDGEILEDTFILQWLDKIAIKPGDILNHGKYELVKSQLITLALARGYFDGKYVQSSIQVNRDANTAKITLHYDSGSRYHMGEVTFEGDGLQDGFLDTLIPFEKNSAYSTGSLSRLNRELLDTSYFSNIKVLPQVDKAQGLDVPIKVELSPKPSHSIELGLGVDIGNTAGSDNELEPRISINWRTPLLNSYGHSLETSLEWSPDRPKYLSTYTIPLTHPLDDQLKIRFGMLRDKYGVNQVYDPNEHKYNNTGELEASKGLIAVIRQQRLKDNWILSYSVEAMKEYYTQSETDYAPKFLLFGTSISKTIRGDNTLDPKSGFFQYYSIEYANPDLGSAIQLTRIQTKYKWINTFFDKHRIVSRLDLGVNLADDADLALIPPSLRYFAGGDQSIRGYSYQELGPYIDYTTEGGDSARQVVGGRYLMVGSLEYQYYVTPTWRVGTFIDAGNAFDVNQIEPIVSVGGGIHWISPIGPIKLDLGVGLKETDTVDRPWRIHLTMGAEL